ncbi:MAG: hypothetical protein K0S45_1138 [Nitrospira sp.]|jgi:hypothetical protein|nr:hypothetical protein [Nitrospira sp.]
MSETAIIRKFRALCDFHGSERLTLRRRLCAGYAGPANAGRGSESHLPREEDSLGKEWPHRGHK